jgi:hypothetical protein
MKRDYIPAKVKRAVLVEAGHRCAISTCRATTTEIAHIVPWAKSKNNSFENLIALCPSCHTRFDQKKEIDEKSIRMYKQNLSILNNRYGEIERRLFESLAISGERVFVLGLGGDILVANAVKDGFFEDRNMEGPQLVLHGSNGYIKKFPMSFAYWVTDVGVEFIERYALGLDITAVSKKANQSNKQPIIDISDEGISVVEREKDKLYFDIPYRSGKNANAHSVKFELIVILKKDGESLESNYNEDDFFVLANQKDIFPDNVCLTYETGRSINFLLEPVDIDCLSRMYICVKGSYKDVTEALSFEVFDVFKYNSSSKFWVRLLDEEDIAVRKLFDKLLELKNSEEDVGD